MFWILAAWRGRLMAGMRPATRGRTALPVAVLGVAALLSLIVGVFLMDWAPAARLGEGGVERWIA